MKKIAVLVLVIAMLICSALAEGPRLTVQLPEDALMIESFEFDDGDYVQSYQLPDGIMVQMLRYAAFDMTLEELAEGEWTGYRDAQSLEVNEIGGCSAQAMRLTDEQGSVIVYTVMLHAQDQTMIFQAVFPKTLGEERIKADMDAWLGNMQVVYMESEEVG